MPEQTPLHQITYPLGTDRADIRVLETMAGDVDRELGELHGLNDAAQGKLITPESATWTPTFGGGFIIGNASIVAEYYAVSGLVRCYIRITSAASGPTTNWGTSYPTFTLPFTPYSTSTSLLRFSSGSRFILGVVLSAGSPSATVYAPNTGATAGVAQYPAYQSTGAAPWATNNIMYGSFSYRRV
jgi:hypothetical protein